MAGLLDAAEALIGEVGIDATSTTAIAARAEASVGSLYYFFPEKEAILEALAERFAARSGAVIAAAARDVGHGPLGRVVPRLTALIRARPAFSVVFDACGQRECASAGLRQLHDVCVGQMHALLEARLPGMPDPARRHAAVLLVSTLYGVFKEVQLLPRRQRGRLLRELQAMLTRYAAALHAQYGLAREPGLSRTSARQRRRG